MPGFSKNSLERLATCHPDLQTVLKEAIKYADFTVLCGHRNEHDQAVAYDTGMSKVEWPDSKHNKLPSLAVDIAPYPIDWKDAQRFIRLLSFVQGVGAGLGIRLRLGGDFNQNFKFDDNFVDWPHLELVL